MKWPIARALLTLSEEGQKEYKETGKINWHHLVCESVEDDRPETFVNIRWVDIRYYYRDGNKLKIIWNDGKLYECFFGTYGEAEAIVSKLEPVQA